MNKSPQSEGTKIAQAAKELNVTSVTIRRYLSEFNIETTADENGVKVLPGQAMQELQLIRQLKEDGLTNPQVLEQLENRRGKPTTDKPKTSSMDIAKQGDEDDEQSAKTSLENEATDSEQTPTDEALQLVATEATRSKHTLTCQTCGKVFEHMNPRLRDCLDCYRTKRKERRRGGSDKHKNVIQHPVVQQVIAKTAQQLPQVEGQSSLQIPTVTHHSTVRNYRKAIEETRGITTSLKRRLERPDLSEGERRWLEQIYAYQLILHQGWRHLAEYKAGNQEPAVNNE